MSFRQLGALSRAETMKLAWSLPALDRLDEHQLDKVWRLAGGHPRSLEYLDALLSGGTARYQDVTARLNTAVTRRLGGADRDRWLAARSGLDAALAETVALAADDVLLDDLLGRLAQVPGAPDLLLGVSVYREPVDLNAVLVPGRAARRRSRGHPRPGRRPTACRRDPGRRRDHPRRYFRPSHDPRRCPDSAGAASGRAEPGAQPSGPRAFGPGRADRGVPGRQLAHRQ